MNNLKYISGECGSGKGIHMKASIRNAPMSNYLIVQPTQMLIDSFVKSMNHPNIQVRTSETNPTDLLASINQVLASTDSTVLFITDKMFYKIDAFRLKGWVIFIDDCVSICEVRNVAKSTKDNIEEVYRRMFITGDYIEVNADVESGVGENAMYRTYELCLYENVSYDLRDAWNRYNELSCYHSYGIYERSLDSDFDQVILFGQYDLTRYMELDLDITYLSNNFEATLLYKFWKYYLTEVEFNKQWREDNNSRLVINYFYKNVEADKYGLSKSTMISDKNDNIKKVQEYINSTLSIPYYWTKNSDDRIKFNLNGDYVTPNQRGINSLQHYEACVLMAAMNPSATVLPHYETLWGFTVSDIKCQWEYETFNQFVYRGIIRNQSSDATMVVYCYDEATARTITGASYNHIELELTQRNKGGRSTKFADHDKALDVRFRSWKKSNSTKPNAKTLFYKWRNKQEQMAEERGECWLDQLDRYEKALGYRA